MASNEIYGHISESRRFGQAAAGHLVSNDIAITRPAVDATITIGSENANVRTINITLKDANGVAIDYVETFEIHMFTSNAMTAYVATGGSTGVAIGTNGAALAVVAKKLFMCTTEADGTWDGTWTDTGTEAFAVGVRLPNGRVVVSATTANT